MALSNINTLIVMTDTIVISADEGLTCCLDSWAVLLIWRNTKYLSVLQDFTVFYPIIASQVIILKYSTIYSQSCTNKEVSNVHHMYYHMVMCVRQQENVWRTSHVLSHSHM